MHIPEKWPRKAERERLFAAIRVLGLEEPLFFVEKRYAQPGATAMRKTHAGDGYIWVKFQSLTTKMQKMKWAAYRAQMRTIVHTSSK